MVKIHQRKFISADPEKCVGCQVCEYACSYSPEKAFNPIKARIRLVRVNQLANMAVTCRLCEDPACVAACPRNALSQAEDTGNIVLDKDKCNGCGWCIEACDYGAMMLHPETKVVYVCDLCKDKADGPQCVKWCPEEALTIVTSDTLAQKARITAIRKLFQEKEENQQLILGFFQPYSFCFTFRLGALPCSVIRSLLCCRILGCLFGTCIYPLRSFRVQGCSVQIP